MARIPTFDRTFMPNMALTVSDTSQQTNAAIQRLGATGVSIATDHLERQKKADDTTWYNQQEIEFRKRVLDAEPEFRKANAENPSDARDKWDMSLQSIRDELAAKAPSEEARQAFMSASDRYREQALGDTDNWARTTQVENFARRTDEAAQSLYNMAYRQPDLKTLDELATKAEQSVIAGSTFMAPDKLEDMRKTIRSNIARSAIEGMMGSGRADEAKTLLNSGVFDGFMDSADIQRMHQQAVSAERADKARIKAEMSEKAALAENEVSNVMDRMKKGYAIPREDMERARTVIESVGDSKVTRKFNTLQQIHTFQTQLRYESPARVREIVGKLQSKAAGKGIPISPEDRDIAIRTMLAEESNAKGQEGVANTILNRLSQGKWGDTVTRVVTAKGQFEPHMTDAGRARMAAIDPQSEQYQQAAQIFDQVASGSSPDITLGATHFISSTTQLAMGREIPAWAKKGKLAEAGATQFFSPDGAPVTNRPVYGYGLSQEEQMRLEVAQGVLEEMTKGLETDPMSTVAGLGAVKVAPVTLQPDESGSTQPIIQSLRDRATTYAAANQVYGGKVNRVFTEDEASSLAEMVKGMSPKERLTYGTMLYQGLGPAAGAAFQQIAPKDPLFSHAAGLSQFQPSAALAILEGQKIAAENPAFLTKGEGKNSFNSVTMDQFQAYTGSAFQAMPSYAASVKQAADAIFISEANKAGLNFQEMFRDKSLVESVWNSDSVVQTLYKKSVDMAMGADPNNTENTGFVTIGNGWFDGREEQKIVLPPGVTKDGFEKFVYSLDRDPVSMRMASMGGVPPMDARGQKLTMKEVLDTGVLVQVGNGAYAVRMPDGNFLRGGGPSGEFILQADPATIRRVDSMPMSQRTLEIRNKPDSGATKFAKTLLGAG